MARVVLAMSGGVDSSVAAHLLRAEGHDVIGVFMRHGNQSPLACGVGAGGAGAGEANRAGADEPRASDPRRLPVVRLDHKQGCCSAADADDARRVADELEIPFYALNLEDDFQRIIDYFVDEYTAARTPNPCVMCNNWLKFGRLFHYADSVGAQYVATGHYARLTEERELDACGNRHVALRRGVDEAKDQSYVLFGVERKLLDRMLLPVGRFRKPEIRAMATRFGLRVAEKKDSQEICFVTSGHHGQFVRDRRGALDTSGELVTSDGRVVGRHDGIEAFTIGQRKGLGVAMGEPYFVVRIEADSRRVVIGRRDELACSSIVAAQCNWLVDRPDQPFRCSVQIRYNSDAAPARVEPLPDNRLHVEFDEPVYGVAPGQAAVCYDGKRVLGGGWIE